jgi:hypothetical protein
MEFVGLPVGIEALPLHMVYTAQKNRLNEAMVIMRPMGMEKAGSRK